MLLFLCLLVSKSYLKISTRIETPEGISSLEEVTLGGISQWIFIRGLNRNNPVLLFLHGGPGEPVMGMSSSRNLDAELIHHFTVIHWDQLGAGKSYNSSIPISSMTFERWVEDCNELIDFLRKRFNTQKVFIVGHSGGSIVGIKIAHKYPEKIHAYVGVSQIINNNEQQKLFYDFIVEEADKSGDVKLQHAVEAIGSPPYDTPEKELKKVKYIIRYGGFIHDKPFKKMGIIVLNYLISPEYSLSEGIKTIAGKGLNFTMNARYEEIRNINFTNEIQSIKVPTYFFMGKYDMITPTDQVENFYHNLDAEEGKRLIIFENSAHLPIIEENEKYRDLLVNVVLKETLEKQIK